MKLGELYAYIYKHVHTYAFIKLSCMHNTVSCNIVANYSAGQYQLKFKSHSTYLTT